MHSYSNSLGSDLSREEVRRILEFLGYGRLSAPVWFIGLEEGLSSLDPADLAYNLKARGSWDNVMDLERACLLLRHQGQPIRIAIKPPRTQTWPWMGRIVGELARRLGWGDRPEASEYVRRRLGRSDPEVGETFLTELSPIPSKKLAGNLYWRNLFRKIEPDCGEIIQGRSIRLSTLVEQNLPLLVFCYGSEKAEATERFKALFPRNSWSKVGSKSQISERDGRITVLMPFFGNGRLSNIEFETVISEVSRRDPGG